MSERNLGIETPSGDSGVLERNLALLLRRSYVPVLPRASFQEALLRDVRSRATQLGRGLARESLPESVRPSPRSSAPRRATWARPASFALAAAASIAIGVFAWRTFRSPRSESLESILARGEVALRHDASASWSAHAAGPSAEALAWPSTSTDGFLELATPRLDLVASAARVTIAAHGELGGELRVLADSRLALEPSDVSDIAARIDLRSGGVELDKRSGAPWKLATPAGGLVVASGEVRVVQELPEDPSAWTGALEREGPWVHVLVRSGRTLASARGETIVLAERSEAFLRGGEAFLRPSGTPSGPALASSLDGRTSVEDPAPPLVDEPQAPLEPGQASLPLVGKVFDAKTRAPIESFNVFLLERVQLPDVADPIVTPFAAASGEFALAPPHEGNFSAFVQADGYALWRVSDLDLGPGERPVALEVALEKGGLVRGLVVDGESGVPIPGALVLSETDAPVQVLPLDPTKQPSFLAARVETGTDGGFALADLSAGTQVLRAKAAGYAASWSAGIELARGETHDGIVLRLQRGGSIEGTVEGDDGTPQEGVLVIASMTDFEAQRPVLSYEPSFTDARGHYALHELPAGRWAVLNFGPLMNGQQGVSPALVFAEVERDKTTVVDFVPRRGASRLSGRVLDAAGEPVRRRSIWATPIVGGNVGPEGDWRSATTDDLGMYRFTDLKRGRYALFVSCQLPAEMVNVGVIEQLGGDRTEDIQLPSGSVAGRVTDARTGEPLAFAVIIVLDHDPARAGGPFMGKVFSDAAGNYLVPGLQAGTYTLTTYATSGDYGQLTREPVQIAEGLPTEQVDFALAAGGVLSLQVSDVASQPIVSAAVKLFDARGALVQFSDDDRTDAQGVFRVRGITAGRWTLEVSAPGFPSAKRELEIVAGETCSVDLTLARE